MVDVNQGKKWWASNGYNMNRWNNMPYRQKLAITLDAKKRGWPVRKTDRKKAATGQLSLFG